MAAIARGGITRSDVVGNGSTQSLRAAPLGNVAAIAGSIRRSQRIVVVHVAVRAGLHAPGGRNNVATGERPPRGAVVEFAVCPGNRVMARRAHRRGELRGNMVGHCATECGSAVPVGGMAAGVIAVRDGKIVIVADVALIAVGDHSRRRHLMIANQSPASGSVSPGWSRERVGGGVAIRAVQAGKSGACRGVHGIVGVLPIGLVATGIRAIGGGDLQVVVAVGVALGAQQRGYRVFASEQEAGRGVIKNGVRPVGGVVARRALRHREAGADVIGDIPSQSLCAVPLRQMAGGISAVGGLNREVVIVVDVAFRAGGCSVSAGQRKSRDGMIKRTDVCPGNCVVAGRAVTHGKRGTRLGVRRIVGLLPGGEVAASVAAIRGSNLQIVVVIDMATGARNVGVASRQGKTSAAVIELGA